jgi:hypothetical protein
MALSGFVLIFLGWVIAQTHAAGGAPYLLVSGLIFVALSLFVWRGSAWSMLLALALSVALAVMIATADPKHWWVCVPVPTLFAILTFLSLSHRRRTRMEQS